MHIQVINQLCLHPAYDDMHCLHAISVNYSLESLMFQALCRICMQRQMAVYRRTTETA